MSFCGEASTIGEMFSWLFTIFVAFASTVSIMAKYVDNERIAGERRMDALYGKKTEILCPGYTQKGMSLCVRQYIKNAKIETASGFVALSHFISVASLQDRNNKIYDEPTALMISLETLVVLQGQLKKEHMVCGKLQPSGPQNLLAVKQVCAQEEEQIREQQAVNKKLIHKQLETILEKTEKYSNPKTKEWFTEKKIEIEKAVKNRFDKIFFQDKDYKITDKDILHQHRLTIQTSCEKLEPKYKNRFNRQNPCELMFSQIFLACVDMPVPRGPASIKEKEIVEIVQKPLPCFYTKMQEYLTSQD